MLWTKVIVGCADAKHGDGIMGANFRCIVAALPIRIHLGKAPVGHLRSSYMCQDLILPRPVLLPDFA